MQESPVTTATTTPSASANRAPLHDDIAQCAQDLWVNYGRPLDRDLAIWLEAEQRMLAAAQRPSRPDSTAAKAGRAAAKTGTATAHPTPAPSRSRFTPIG